MSLRCRSPRTACARPTGPIERQRTTVRSGVVGEHDGVHRRSVRENTSLVRRTLDRIDDAGVTWAPQFIRHDAGEEVLSWLPGKTVDEWQSRPGLLDELTGVVRQLHDLTVDLAPDHECLVHDDLQPRNVVVDHGRLGLIDWEQLRPGRRIEDVAQLCWSFAGPIMNEDAETVSGRWSRILDVYGPLDRSELVSVAVAKIDRCIDDIVRNASLGSARHHEFNERGDRADLERLRCWLDDHRTAVKSALG